MTSITFTRTAHPYRDTQVIDARAPRTNQAIVGTLSLVAILTGWWGILAALALQLAIGLTFGRRYCLPCLLYFELIQPRLGEGPIEDSRPPRFANVVGVAFLTTATVAYATGLVPAGQALAGIVAALALLAATTGLCVGCEIYRLAARLRGVRSRLIDRVDLGELGAVVEGEVVVEFTHPLCTDCRALERKLRGEGRPVLTIDVSQRPDIARKYGVVVVPTAVLVASDGVVRALSPEADPGGSPVRAGGQLASASRRARARAGGARPAGRPAPACGSCRRRTCRRGSPRTFPSRG